MYCRYLVEPLSALLAAANEQLQQRRQQLGISNTSRGAVETASTEDVVVRYAQAKLKALREQHGVVQKQPYMLDNGWVAEVEGETAVVPCATPETPAAAPPEPEPTILVQPSLAIAFLEQQLTAVGRIYYLLRYLDKKGQGWVAISTARMALTGKNGRYCVCGWRRLRQILAEGEGIVWQRENGRIWLRSVAKIAFKLGCHRLAGQPTQLPVQALLGGIQRVRAHFYASFHRGRESAPISRRTLTAVTSIPERTQRQYDQIAAIKRQVNYAIGERYSQASLEKRAWQHGSAVFSFFDSDGQQGEPYGEYVAWQLPNSYVGSATTRSKRSRKRINQRLADLWTNGAVGNDKPEIDRVFWPDGATAAKMYNRQAAAAAYWPRAETRQQQQLWAVIG